MVKASDNTRCPVSGDDFLVIIVAAGSGSRFGSDVPKQFLKLDGKPVLMHSVETFRKALPGCGIIIVLSEWGRDYWRELCEDCGFDSPATVIGGATRTESVQHALTSSEALPYREKTVMIHDGARPLVSENLILRVAEAFSDSKVSAVVPVLPLTEAIAAADGSKVRPADRSLFRTVQTPQAFRMNQLLEAYARLDGQSLPDDAAVWCRWSGKPLDTVDGDTANIKITHPRDLAVAAILSRQD